MLSKPNRLKQVLAEGRIPVGHMLYEFGTCGIAKMLEHAQLDFVVIDMEHSSFGFDDVADLVAWLKATPIAPLVRIPEIQYQLIARVLDAGALGVVVPNVETAQQARAVVAAAKYAPQGHRRVYSGGPSSDFRNVAAESFGQYLDACNANTSVICMIESPLGVTNVDGIAGTAGVDGIWVGYADLTVAMGIPGEYQDRRFADALRTVVASAKAHGVSAVIQPGNPHQLREWLAVGFDVISYGADSYLYRDALTAAVNEVRSIIGR